MSTNQKTTGSAISPLKKLSPCKKFGLAMKIKNEIKTSLRQNEIWTHVIPSSLLKRFESDVLNRITPVKGTEYKDFSYNLIDVVCLLKHMEIEVHESFKGKKLRDSPMFSNNDLKVPSGEFGDIIIEQGSQKEFLERYDNANKTYLSKQAHSIQGPFKYDIWSTYVLCLEMALEHIKDHSVYTPPQLS